MNIKISNCGGCPCQNVEENNMFCNVLRLPIFYESEILENCPLNNAQDNQIVITKE